MKITIEVEILKVAGVEIRGKLARDKNVLSSLNKLMKKYCDGTDVYFEKAHMKTKTTFKIQ
jgi:hypothetical protein